MIQKLTRTNYQPFQISAKDLLHSLKCNNQETLCPKDQPYSLKIIDCNHEQLDSIISDLINQEWHLQLFELDISINQLTTLPDSIGHLSALKTLICEQNQLCELPNSIGLLSNLEALYCSWNKLTALPNSIEQLSSLKTIDCSWNKLTILPNLLNSLKALQSLDCSINQLTALPKSYEQLSVIIVLNCSYNLLTALPNFHKQLSTIMVLNCSHNRLSALPDSLGQLSSLQNLDCSDNQLTTLANSLGELPALEKFDCSNNLLTALPIHAPDWHRVQKQALLNHYEALFQSLQLELLRFKDLYRMLCQIKLAIVTHAKPLTLTNPNIDSISAKLFFAVMLNDEILYKILSLVTPQQEPLEVGFKQITHSCNSTNAGFFSHFFKYSNKDKKNQLETKTDIVLDSKTLIPSAQINL